MARWEAVEGMLTTVRAITGDLTVSQSTDLCRYGEVLLTANGRLRQYTENHRPDAAGYSQSLAADALRQVWLDDGSTLADPDPMVLPQRTDGVPVSGLSAANTLRGGYTVASVTGVVNFAFGKYLVEPVAGHPTDFVTTNGRTAASPNVGGELRVAGFSLENFMNGNGNGADFPTPRGAVSPQEFDRQWPKCVAAILGLNADVIGLREIENDFYRTWETRAIEKLVNDLNLATAPGTYDWINASNMPLGSDVVACALIYKPGRVMPVGPWATDYASVYDNERQPLAQTFEQVGTADKFNVAVCHFRSRLDTGLATGDDVDAGDGAGAWNGDRFRSAQRLHQWIQSDPTGQGVPGWLVLGDFNAYGQEDPLWWLTGHEVNGVPAPANAWTDLMPADGGVSPYTYVYAGRAGSLDHVLADRTMVAQVTGVAVWHINADEPSSLDYKLGSKSAAQQTLFYDPDAYRSSDHDPMIVGLGLWPVPQPYVIAGTAGEDVVRLAVDADDPALVRVSIDRPGADSDEESVVPLATVFQWQVRLDAGRDEFVIDFSHGSPLPAPEGLVFDGGDGVDSLVITGIGGSEAGLAVSRNQVQVGAGPAMTLTNVESFSLSGVNTYGGGTTIANTTLVAAGAWSLPTSGSLTIGVGATAVLPPGLSAGQGGSAALAMTAPTEARTIPNDLLASSATPMAVTTTRSAVESTSTFVGRAIGSRAPMTNWPYQSLAPRISLAQKARDVVLQSYFAGPSTRELAWLPAMAAADGWKPGKRRAAVHLAAVQDGVLALAVGGGAARIALPGKHGTHGRKRSYATPTAAVYYRIHSHNYQCKEV
jgi:hypothetical protein